MSEESSLTKSFWQINIGHVLVMASMLGSILVLFLTYDHAIRDNANGLANHIKEHEIQVRSRLAADLIMNDRIRALEDARTLIGPQLSRMDEKLNWITDWIKEQKNQKLAK